MVKNLESDPEHLRRDVSSGGTVATILGHAIDVVIETQPGGEGLTLGKK